MADVSSSRAIAPLIGRDAEVAALESWLERARQGTPTIALVAGEAGVGKTRLAAEVAERARTAGFTVIAGQALELGDEGAPFAAVASALRSLVAEVGQPEVVAAAGSGLAELARLLPDLGAAPARGESGRPLSEVICDLVERLAAERPLLVVLEDVHWADAATRSLLRHLSVALRRARVLLIATYRSDELTRSHPLRPLLAELDRTAQRIDLSRLAPADTRRLLRALSDDRVTDAVAERIVARSAGVPFFAEELLTAEAEGCPLPDTLRSLLLVRVERLSPTAQEVLRAASAAGVHVDHEVLSQAVDLSELELEHALRQAVAGNILVVDEARTGYQFRHALYREALHGDLLPGEHRRLHVRFAEALQAQAGEGLDGQSAAAIAHHWRAAHDLPRAFSAAIRAADVAAELRAWEQERLMIERALELWDVVPDPEGAAGADRGDLHARAATAAYRSSHEERGLAHIDSALDSVDRVTDPARVLRLLVQRAVLLRALNRSEAAEALVEALDLAEGSGPPVRGGPEHATVLARLALDRMLRGDYATARDLALDAIAMARTAGDPGEEAHALNTLGCALVSLGAVDEGLAAMEQSRIASPPRDRDPIQFHLNRYYANRTDLMMALGRHEEALALAEEGRRIAAEGGTLRSAGAFHAGNLAEVLLMTGRWGRAEQLLEEALALRAGPQYTVHLVYLRGWLRAWHGDLPGAGADATWARREWGTRELDPQHATGVALLETEIALAEGRADAADVGLGALLAAQGLHHPTSAARLASVAARGVAEGDTGRVRQLEEVLADIEGRLVTPIPWVELVRAELSGRTDPERWQDLAARLEGLPPWRAHALLRSAEASLACGDRPAAQEAVAAGSAIADDLGAAVIGARLKGLARRARLGLPGGVIAAAPYGLTDRELEVLRLLATGRSNKQIAVDLFISPKTASVHVSHILTKLGVAGRGEAAAQAYREGLVPTAPGQGP
jgi:DNA-binding CsgD family transcriptional regulator/tetratricopeptide (TPR) repeat protein